VSASPPRAWREVAELLERAVAERAFPGAVLAAGATGGPVHVSAHGRLTYAPDSAAVGRDTIYDLASLTKVVVTTTMAMMLFEDGALDLEAPVSLQVPAFRGGGKERVSAAQLLSHSSGIAWWAPLFKELTGRDAFLVRICEMPLEYEPGTKAVYSDFGFILLGEVLERIAGESLDSFVRARLLVPLGMTDTGYRPSVSVRPRIAPTEECAWRGRLVWGEVHDENAYAMGGVAPQAGLFASATDLARFAGLLLGGGAAQGRRLLRPETIERFTRRVGVAGATRALGWDTPNDEGYSTAGRLMSRRAYGHIGFTGTSLWIDPERSVYVVFLTNRVHPTRANDKIRGVRPAVTDAAVRAIAADGARIS
jgi:CubicO group peptidase (beta-lactamase class C family)